ncbi:MAG: hypothetical protein WC438_02875 [Candidatus Pacearchaeota archaeon]
MNKLFKFIWRISENLFVLVFGILVCIGILFIIGIFAFEFIIWMFVISIIIMFVKWYFR